MATQKGRNWSSGDIVTAANLSSVERGVSAVAEEYTPTTWANGDTVTAAALNNIEQGIANAGGGSSDFSTAQVTIASDGPYVDGLLICCISIISYVSDECITVFNAPDTGVFTVPLFNGVSSAIYIGSRAVSVNGDATYYPMDGIIIITGDCTITIS